MQTSGLASLSLHLLGCHTETFIVWDHRAVCAVFVTHTFMWLTGHGSRSGCFSVSVSPAGSGAPASEPASEEASGTVYLGKDLSDHPKPCRIWHLPHDPFCMVPHSHLLVSCALAPWSNGQASEAACVSHLCFCTCCFPHHLQCTDHW